MKRSFLESRKLNKDNPATTWGKHDLNSEWNASTRMNEEYMRLYLPKPQFVIPRDSTFFAIGSCFARGIENALRGQKMDVASFDNGFQSWETANNLVTPQGAMNKYNPLSVLQEIEWSQDFSEFPSEMVMDLTADASVDLSLNQTLKLVNRKETFERHKFISNCIFNRIWSSDVVFITLGLIEVWTDELTGLALNGAPSPVLLKRYPERFSVRTMKIDEIFDSLRNIVGKLISGEKEKRIFLTVSPVPLMRTFSGNDVIVANTTSKSRLKAVVSEVVEEFEEVNYFPSYEIVLNSQITSAWEDDRRHVKGPMTQYIMRTFINHYIGE